jgi:hypothetical protein
VTTHRNDHATSDEARRLILRWIVVAGQAATLLVTYRLWQVRESVPHLPLFDLPAWMQFAPLWPLLASLIAVLVRPLIGIALHSVLLLVAIALAAELRESSERSDKIESHARESLGGLLERVDTAIADSDAIEKEREGRRKRNSNKGLSNKALSSLAPSGEPAPSDDA